jgi:hypothetical protein
MLYFSTMRIASEPVTLVLRVIIMLLRWRDILIAFSGSYSKSRDDDDDLFAMRPGQSRRHEILRQLRRGAS